MWKKKHGASFAEEIAPPPGDVSSSCTGVQVLLGVPAGR
jgi:hypothetical protein